MSRRTSAKEHLTPHDAWRQTLIVAWREHRLSTIASQSRDFRGRFLNEKPCDNRTASDQMSLGNRRVALS